VSDTIGLCCAVIVVTLGLLGLLWICVHAKKVRR
jgi:hypothetical protein